MSQIWQPSAEITLLKQRAFLLSQIRQFFAQKNVLEVETPALSHASITDVHLHPFTTMLALPNSDDKQKLFLQTSPEFHMKRLLASGSGSIYQIAKAFRNEEAGRYHNPEFTLLEWYKVGFTHHDLMDEMDELLTLLLKTAKAERLSYQQAFESVIGICPLESSLLALKKAATAFGYAEIAKDEQDKDTLLQLLFSMEVERKIGQNKPVFVYDFPASQAALARVSENDSRVAARFELYFKGVELANGFYELTDAKEQLARFEQDNQKRAQMGLPIQPVDMHLISSLEHGLPDCAGVALGLDRLFMLALGKKHIDEVLAFPAARA